MEEKINYVVITNEEYRELVENNIKLDIYTDDLIKEKKELGKEIAEFKKNIVSKIFREEEYHLKNIKIENGEVVKDYDYSYIQKEFNDYGIFDVNYIDEEILKYKKQEGEIDE